MSEYNTYPRSYHNAIRNLIACGDRPSNLVRSIVAHALVDLRRDFGSERAQSERRHMLSIAGTFPGKAA